jgi:xylose isomerase
MSEYFKSIPKIQYEGAGSDNPLAFKYYNPAEKIGGKTMAEHLRVSVAYWHSFCGAGTDPFGSASIVRGWDHISDPVERAKQKMHAAFEFFGKLGNPFFCFHDADISPEGASLRESNRNLDVMISLAKELMKEKGTKLLWGTANLTANPRYVHGAATSCNADVFAYAAAQVKKAIEVTHELAGEGYVFWGGREGYDTLLNTDMALELDNYARLLRMASEYAKEIGFHGQMYIEPKPKEPTKHQYDFDAANVFAFLKKYGLDKSFKLNIETNHATLAGHNVQHELRYARINNIFGSIDANTGDLLLGWDTDQFAMNIYETVATMYEVIKAGGFTTGGLNFDAKVRRGSFEPSDLFYGHISSMDAFAKGFKVAYDIVTSGKIDSLTEERYSSYTSGIGKDIVSGNLKLQDLEKYALDHSDIKNVSGRQEYLEMLINQHIFK